MGRAAERIADPDVALAVDGRTRHPAVETVRRVGALLAYPQRSVRRDRELVPPHAAAERRGLDRVHRDDRLAPVHVPVHHARHELVALRVEMLVGARLAHARRQLAVAQIVVRSDRDLLRSGEARVRGVGPVDREAPRVNPVVIEDAVQLCAAGSQDHVGCPSGRQRLAVEIRVVQKVHPVHDHALLGRRLAEQHVPAIDGARVLLDDVVAGAGRYVIAVGPNGGPRIIREERPQEFVAIVRAERIGARADRIAHRERALLLGWPRRTCSGCGVRRRRWRRRHGGRHEQWRRWSGLIGHTGRADVGAV